MECLDALGFPAPGLPVRVQQVLERLSLEGLVGHSPETEACHHRAVRAPQRRCVRVIGKVEAVAFGQLRSSVCFSHAALHVTRRLLPDQSLFTRVRGREILRTSSLRRSKKLARSGFAAFLLLHLLAGASDLHSDEPKGGYGRLSLVPYAPKVFLVRPKAPVLLQPLVHPEDTP
jgi:hypothetical protein